MAKPASRRGLPGGALIPVVLAIALAAVSLRSLLVVAATPPALWTVEQPAFDLRTDAAAAAWPGAAGAAADRMAVFAATAACAAGDAVCRLAAVDAALRVAPTTAALWLERAQLLARTGPPGAALWQALAASIAVAPREGWIAARRVVLLLQLRPLLPPELLAGLDADLDLVLAQRSRALVLIAALQADPVLAVTALATVAERAGAEGEQRLRRLLEAAP